VKRKKRRSLLNGAVLHSGLSFESMRADCDNPICTYTNSQHYINRQSVKCVECGLVTIFRNRAQREHYIARWLLIYPENMERKEDD
jgi:hypothetical protein